jgi:hypothetical protein
MKILKHYTNSIFSYVSRIIYTYFFEQYWTEVTKIFFVVYFLVIIQSFVINSTKIFQIRLTSKNFVFFIVINVILSSIEFYFIKVLLSFIPTLTLATSLSALSTSLVRYLTYKHLIFKT